MFHKLDPELWDPELSPSWAHATMTECWVTDERDLECKPHTNLARVLLRFPLRSRMQRNDTISWLCNAILKTFVVTRSICIDWLNSVMLSHSDGVVRGEPQKAFYFLSLNFPLWIQSLAFHVVRRGNSPRKSQYSDCYSGSCSVTGVLVSRRPVSSLKPSKMRILNCVTTEGLSRFHILFKFEMSLLRRIVPAQLWVESGMGIQRGQDNVSSRWRQLETELHEWLALLGQTPSFSVLRADLCPSL